MIKTADDAKRELEKVMKYSKSDAEQAIAAGVLSLLGDMGTLHKRLLAIEKHLGLR